MNSSSRPGPNQLAAAHWIKSSYSGPDGNECVEVAELNGWVGIRDSKQADGSVLVLPTDAVGAFMHAVTVIDS